jgi:hypothetical protein
MQSQETSSREKGPLRNPGQEEENTSRPLISSTETIELEVSYDRSATPSILQIEDSFLSTKSARPIKRIKLSSSHQTQLDPELLLIHQVICEQQSTNHDSHPQTSYFLDAPRLFAGDNKASPLRGKSSISNVDEHVEDSNHVSIIIYRTYYCDDYHESIQREFERLNLSDYHVRTVPAMRPYLFVLREDMDVATCVSEEMTLLSFDLKAALKKLEEIDPIIDYNSFSGDNWGLKAPYLQLYHFRGLIRQSTPRLTSVEERKHVDVLLSYIDEAFRDDYAEADSLFAKGLVSQKHHSKLFRPNEIVMTAREGQPVGSVAKGFPRTGPSNTTLYCEDWSFNGVFSQNGSLKNLEWPSTLSEILPIVDLDLFPLKYDNAGTNQRLLRRGQLLWNCRKRGYMSYRVPGSESDPEAVRIQ